MCACLAHVFKLEQVSKGGLNQDKVILTLLSHLGLNSVLDTSLVLSAWLYTADLRVINQFKLLIRFPEFVPTMLPNRGK